METAAPRLKARLDKELERYGLGPDRLILIGFSQGTMMALHLVSADPELCALVVGYSGMLASQPVPGSGAAITLVHGSADPVVPVAGSQKAAEAFTAAGRATELHVLPHVPHTISEEGALIGLSALQRVIGQE